MLVLMAQQKRALDLERLPDICDAEADPGSEIPPETTARSPAADVYVMGASAVPESSALNANGWWYPACRTTVAPPVGNSTALR